MSVKIAENLLDTIVFQRRISGKGHEERGLTRQEGLRHPPHVNEETTSEDSQNGMSGRLGTTSLHRSNSDSR